MSCELDQLADRVRNGSDPVRSLAGRDRATRIRRIVTLLEAWQDLHLPDANDGGAGDGGGWITPRIARHPSVLELGRCLELLRYIAPGHFMHLAAFFAAERRQIRRWVPSRDREGRIRRVHGRVVLELGPWELERLVLPWVELELVERGVRFLEAVFDGPVFLPGELAD